MNIKVGIMSLLILPGSLMAGEKINLGPASTFIERLDQEQTSLTSKYYLTTTSKEIVDLNVEDYHKEGDYIAIHGHALDYEGSSFLLKGTSSSIYGFVALRGINKAYEYKTDASGNVIAEEVDIQTVHPVCDIQRPDDQSDFYFELPFAGNLPSYVHIGSYPGTNVNKLQSIPGAKKVIYMDITSIMDGDTPKKNGKFDKAQMWETWQSLVSSLSMYEVNVTTDPEVYKKAGVKNSAIAKFYNKKGRANAPLNSFGTTRSSTNYYIGEDGYGLGRTLAHEVGHQVGLRHDKGNPGGEYFTGFPEFKWTPLMGNFWPGNRWGDQALYQWSKSEYKSGTNKQDDLKVVEKYLPFKEDDIPTSKALVVENGQIKSAKNRGQIHKNTDTDSFTFEVKADSEIKLKIDRIEYIGGAMLDVDASLKDSSGKEIARDNPKAARYAEISTDLKPGKYTLVIKGGAEGTPQKGFSNYSSLGYYGIEGSLSD